MKILLALIGWLAFNLLILRIEKEKSDKKAEHFNFKSFKEQRWDDWLYSLIFVPIILYIDHAALDINVLEAIEPGAMKWSDLQIFGSGFYSEIVFYAFQNWKKKKDESN